jgi:hypothetical protein
MCEVDLVAVKGKTQSGRNYTLPSELIERDQLFSEHCMLLTAYR